MKTVVIDGTTVNMEKLVMEGVLKMIAKKEAHPGLMDGKFIFVAGKVVKSGPAWRQFAYDFERFQSELWHFVFHNVFLGEGPQVSWVPSHCQGCYKVVAKPKTWKKFMELNDVMEAENLHSKCGVENRPYVRGLYGGYFYNRGVEEGLEKLDYVRSIVPDGIPVFLKRGCTELEISEGPSDKWTITDEQLEVEEFFEKSVGLQFREDLEQTEENLKLVLEYWEAFSLKYDVTRLSDFPDPQYFVYEGGKA